MRHGKLITLLAGTAFLFLNARGDAAGPERALTETASTLDVSLGSRKLLTGKLVTPGGDPIAAARIDFHRGPLLAATTITDDRGRFSIVLPAADVYWVRANGCSIICRAWAKGTAPPVAINQLLLVSGGGVIRGQTAGSFWPYYLPAGIVVGGIIAYRLSQDTAS